MCKSVCYIFLAAFCDVYAVDHEAQTNVGTVPLDNNVEINQSEYDALGTSHLVKSDRPLAIYCGTLIDTHLQLPPVETLGKQFYIPAIALTTLTADATVVVLTTEDSTIVTIRGDYDQMDTIDLKGEVMVNRTIVSDTKYSIEATKPVHVHLQIRSNTVNLAADVFIPAITQYKKDHVFPGFIEHFVEIHSSFAVDNGGYETPSLISTGATSINAATYVYNKPTFSLTVMKYLGTTKFFIVPSDVLYQDINEVCTLTTGSPGDGVDNDCDGLIDEEQCSDSTAPGTIDFDIDGSLHEDCAANTSTTASVLHESVPQTMITCPPATGNGSNVNDTDAGGIVISGTNSTDDSVSLTSMNTPNVTTTGSAPSFEPLTFIGPSITIPTTAPAPGSTPPPVETCRTECLCPCGWVANPQNYTEEELAASVVEIQEKLKVKKTELSAVIRQKTSATDDRPAATAVGFAGLAFMVVVLGTVALLDITTLFCDIITLGRTVKTFFTS
ncbi:uncharacterized protein LOC123540926 [Mercenaria mercenaria]|uniref:uncharacterized protein LOC123540926 n=1 Tax=Mercenaria mercenaria TaxID=6596 RepID=UPI00234EA539|nr:uncharacterized protein LOC123540926 [Mercenaria mercenaria]